MGINVLATIPLALLVGPLMALSTQAQPINPAYVPPHQRAATALPAPSPIPDAAPEWHLHSGRYQTLDGLWHAARIAPWQHDRVVLHDEGDPLRQLLNPEAIRRFVREGEADTVVTVRDLVLPGTRRVEPPVLARQVLRGRGLTLYRYSRLENRSWWAMLFFPHEGETLLLRQGSGTVLALPRSRPRLQALLLQVVAADPASVAQVRTQRLRLWRDAEPLLRAYTERL